MILYMAIIVRIAHGHMPKNSDGNLLIKIMTLQMFSHHSTSIASSYSFDRKRCISDI